MIATLGRRTLSVLPHVMLLMHQRAADLHIALVKEAVRIQRELVPANLIQPAIEPIRTEVTERAGFSLVRYKYVRELAAEQLLVEVIVRSLQAAVLNRGDCIRLPHLTRHGRS